MGLVLIALMLAAVVIFGLLGCSNLVFRAFGE
jgi:hypothetical protein